MEQEKNKSWIPSDAFQEINAKKVERIDETKRRLRRVSPELLSQFLIEKGVNRTCLSCGATGISVPEIMSLSKDAIPPDVYKQMISGEELEVDIESYMIRSVAFTPTNPKKLVSVGDYQFRLNCNNCGYISHYRASPVVFWVEKMDEDSQEAE